MPSPERPGRGERSTPREWGRRGPHPLDNSLTTSSSRFSGWTEGLRDPSDLCMGAPALQVALIRARPPALRRRRGPGTERRVRAAGPAVADPALRRGLRPGHPRTAGAPGLPARSRVRRGVLLHPHRLDARGRRACLDRAVAAGDPVLRRAGDALDGAPAAPALAALVRGRVGDGRGGAQRMAARGDALGPAGVRRRRHTGRSRSRLRRRGRRELPARPAGGAGGGSRPGRPRERAAPSAGVGAHGAAGAPRGPGRVPVGRRPPTTTPRSTWPSCRATCRAGATTSSTTTGRSPRTTSTPRWTSPSGWRAARRTSPTSCCGRRTPPRRTRSTMPPPTARSSRRARPSGSRSWSAPSWTAVPTRSSTRASSGTRRPARGTATPSGTRSRSASTSRSARSSCATTSSTGSGTSAATC